ITWRSMKSATKSVWMSGASPGPSQTTSVVSLMCGSGVSVRPVTTPAERGADSAPPLFGSSFALTMIVRGPRTTMPARSGLPIDTRRTVPRNWRMRVLPLRSQIGAPGSSGALSFASVSAGISSFSIPSVTARSERARASDSSKCSRPARWLRALHEDSATAATTKVASARAESRLLMPLPLLLDERARREHPDVLHDHPAPHVVLLTPRRGDDDVDVAVRGDEAAHAGDAVHLHRHRAHALVDHQRQEPGALGDELRPGDRLVLPDRRPRDAADDLLRIVDRALRQRVRRPGHHLQGVGADARADRDRVARNHHVGHRVLPRSAGRLHLHVHRLQVAVDHR